MSKFSFQKYSYTLDFPMQCKTSSDEPHDFGWQTGIFTDKEARRLVREKHAKDSPA